MQQVNKFTEAYYMTGFLASTLILYSTHKQRPTAHTGVNILMHFHKYIHCFVLKATICCVALSKWLLDIKDWKHSTKNILQKELFFYLIYVKGNTSRFGSAIRVLPSDNREYFDSHFITGVVVFIFIIILFLKNIFFIYCKFFCQK